MFDSIVSLITDSGYAGIFLLMFAENIFPPIPSELIMPLAGFAAARGDLSMPLVIASGVAGSIAGALPWYFAGFALGEDGLKDLASKHGRWLTVTPKEISRAIIWFDQHGNAAIFLGRLIPAIRSLISVPAGIAKMRMPAFIGYSSGGAFLWTGLLAAAGYFLEAQYGAVALYLDPISKGVVAIVVVGYLYRLIRQTYRKD